MIDFILLREVQTNFLMLQTVAKMQNDVGMTSQIDCFRFISVFGNNFTKIRCKFDEKTSLSGKLVYKKNHFSRLVLSAPVAMATVYKFEICY